MKIVLIILAVIGGLFVLLVLAGVILSLLIGPEEGPFDYRHGKPDKYL